MTDSLSLDYNTSNGLEKPKLPYLPGNQLSVASHRPPPPTDGRVSLTFKTARERELVDVVTRCQNHPPLEGKLIPEERFNLKILETIRVGDGKSAQVVSVQILSGPRLVDLELVAKLYDPLYYDHSSDDADPFLCVDRHYTHETAAYVHLSGSVNIIPRYYCSYSWKVSVNENQSRLVRLILIEKVNGLSMDRIDPRMLTVELRKCIMKRVVDAESWLYQQNVRHGDIHPRNILVQQLESTPEDPAVTFIDFGRAIIGRSHDPTDLEEEEKYLPGTYISPRLRWSMSSSWRAYPHAFKDWITWDWQSWLEDEYEGDEITEQMRLLWPPLRTKPLPPPPDLR
ncbi:hypothetical protein Plec18170_003204 [Paecilomyces lecythidis]